MSETDFISRLDSYLSQADETLKPFDNQIEYFWNDRRDRVSIHSSLFRADIMHLVKKGVLVMANLSLVAYPYKRKIEEHISHALTEIFESKRGV